MLSSPLTRVWRWIWPIASLVLLWVFCRSAVYAALVAGIAAFLFTPLHRRLSPRLRPGGAAILCMVILLLPIALLLAALPYLLHNGQRIFAAAGELIADLRGEALAWLSAAVERGLPEAFAQGVRQVIGESVSQTGGQAAAEWVSALPGAIGRLWWLATVPFLGFFLLRDRELILDRTLALFPTPARVRMRRAMDGVSTILYDYLRAQAIISGYVAIMTSLVLHLLGLPMGWLLGIMYFFLNFIPYVGPLIGMLPVAAVAAPLGMFRCLCAIGGILLVQQSENYLVTPRVMSKKVGLHPALVLLALLAAGSLSGLAGMILVLPALLSLREIVKAMRV